MKLEGFIFSPKPGYGILKIKQGQIDALSYRKPPKAIRRLIVPGFVCTHIHTVQTRARNTAENLELLDWLKDIIWPFEAQLQAKSAYESAYIGMKECLQMGITTILDMATSRHTQSVFKAAADSGIRAFIGKALMDQGPKSLLEKDPLQELPDLLADWHGYDQGRLQVTLCPRFVLSCSPKLLESVGDLSSRLGLIHHTHASENLRECEWISKNLKGSNIEVLHRFGALNSHTVIAHGVHLSKKDLEILRKTRTTVSHCPTSNLKLASGIADIKRMKGISLSLGVDGAACNNLLDPFFEMRLAHLLSRGIHGLSGMSAQEIFEISTLGGAKALHQEHRIGSLQVHKEADLLVIDIPEERQFNPRWPFESLLHSVNSSDISSIWIRGKRVHSK